MASVKRLVHRLSLALVARWAVAPQYHCFQRSQSRIATVGPPGSKEKRWQKRPFCAERKFASLWRCLWIFIIQPSKSLPPSTSVATAPELWRRGLAAESAAFGSIDPWQFLLACPRRSLSTLYGWFFCDRNRDVLSEGRLDKTQQTPFDRL